MGSYRPTALISTIGKTLKRLIANRLSWWFDEHSVLSSWIADFRNGRSTTDQCRRLSQFISDEYQSAQCRRTVATFSDISRAYDRVWRNGLMMNMSKMGVPRDFTEWLSSLFINCTDRVRVKSPLGLFGTFKKGLPQDSILYSPIFTIFIDDLLVEFVDDIFVSAYADDQAIAAAPAI